MPEVGDLTTASSVLATHQVLLTDPAGPTSEKATVQSLLQATSVDNTAYIRTDGTRAFTGNQSMGSNKLTNVADPTAANDAANKSYVDAAASGYTVLPAAVAATTAAGTLASDFEDGDTLDGVTLSTNDIILIKDQASGIENGLYVVQASGAPSRHADLPSAASASGAFVFVTGGTTNTGTAWVCNNASGSDVVDTDALVFAQVDGPPGGGAPSTAAYVVLAADAVLSHERILIGSQGVTFTDAGAGNNVTLALDINNLTADATPDTSADYVATYDADGATHKKVLIDDLGTTLPVDDGTAVVKGSGDPTKLVRIEADGLTTATTRVITMPDQNVDLTPGSGTFFDASGALGDLSDVTETAPTANQVLRYNSGWVNATFDATWIGTGTVIHERGGLEADVSAYSGLLAVSGGATSEVDSKAELEAQIADVSDFAMADGDVYSGTHDFGGADSLEIPNSATPTVNADGEIALDTTITDWSHGIIRYYGGEELFLVAMPVSELTSPANAEAIVYNATDDEFRLEDINNLVAPGKANFEVFHPGAGVASSTTVTGGSAPAESVQAFRFQEAAGTGTDHLDYKVMMRGYQGGGLTIDLVWKSSATSGNCVWQVAIRRLQDDTDAIESAHSYVFNTVTAPAGSSANEVLYETVTFTDGADMDNWTDGEMALIRVYRDAGHASDNLGQDAYLLGMIPRET